MDIRTATGETQIAELKVGDKINMSGIIFTGRDAVLPRIVRLIEENRLGELGLDLGGAVVFHTAVSDAGIGPTSSNKVEIEGSIPALSKAGVKIHLGKGSLSAETVETLAEYNSVFVVTPPVTALFSKSILSKEIAAFSELGMEAFYRLTVKNIPGIVAIAHNKTIF